MIHSHFESNGGEAVIVLQPNHSWTWRANLYLVASLMLVSCTVGVVLFTMGYWLVLVFTLLELMFLACALYYCVNRTHVQEVIRMTQDQLVLERGVRTPKQKVSVARFFARFLVLPGRYRSDHNTLVLRTNDQVIPVGSFLTAQEQDQLVRLLRRTISHFDLAPRS